MFVGLVQWYNNPDKKKNLMLSSCGILSREVIVLPDSRVLEPHPSKEYWTCISDGYFQEIVKELENCK